MVERFEVNKDKSNWTIEELAGMVKERALELFKDDCTRSAPSFKIQLSDYIDSLKLEKPDILWSMIESYTWSVQDAIGQQKIEVFKERIKNMIDEA